MTIRAKAAVEPWELEAGVDFDDTFTYKVKSTGLPIDLTGYSASLGIKEELSDAAFTDELTTGNGRLVLGDAAGTIQCIWTAAETAGYTFNSAHYELNLIDGASKVSRIMRGKLTIIKEV